MIRFALIDLAPPAQSTTGQTVLGLYRTTAEARVAWEHAHDITQRQQFQIVTVREPHE